MPFPEDGFKAFNELVNENYSSPIARRVMEHLKLAGEVDLRTGGGQALTLHMGDRGLADDVSFSFLDHSRQVRIFFWAHIEMVGSHKGYVTD
jgi:hypothetical protein